MTRIRVRTLGGLRVECDGEELRDLPAQPVRAALFLYLALERSATRDELMALFWPERDAGRARHSLSQTLYELRRSLGDGWAESVGERVQVAPSVGVDVLELVAAVEEGRDEAALALYRGAFLAGCHPGGTSAFEEWVDRRRLALGRLYRDLCRRLTDARVAAGELEGALAVAGAWAEADPLDDEAQHRLVELLSRTGRRAEALRQYDAYRELLASELQVEPLDETTELVARIRSGDSADGRGWWPARPGPLGQAGEGAQAPSPAAAAPSPPPARAGAEAHGWLLGTLAAGTLLGAILLWDGARGVPPVSPPDAGVRDAARGIAVLPFLNMGSDPEQEYFSDGITEDLLTSLSRIEGLRVISRTSVMRYKGTEAPIPEIARELGVDYVLEGSVRREGNQVRITAQLIDASSDAHLWAEVYDRELTGIFQVQGEIAQRIAGALEQRLSPADRARLQGAGTASLSAYDLLLRGREYLNRPGDGDLRKYPLAVDFFRRALEVDPGYARGYAGLGEAFRRNVVLPAVPVRRDSMLAYARRAVELDPELGEAAAELGFAYLYAGEREGAEAAFRRAIALDPNHAEALEGMARLSAVGGRLDEAARWQRRAVAVDPLSAPRLARLGGYLFDLGELDGARELLERAVVLAPDYPEASYLLAGVHLVRGEEERAEARMRTLVRTAADHAGVHFTVASFEAGRGRYREADARLAGSPAAGAPAVLVFRALVAMRLGDGHRAAELFRGPDAMLAGWERAGLTIPPRARLHRHVLAGDHDGALATVREHWRSGLRWIEDPPHIGVYWLDHDPLMADLRDDPRFRALLAEMRAELDAMRAGLQEEERRPAAGRAARR
jgi:TolB-like protein/DNA-binding SARP family transcriptional activator/Tfp pilus assembly protein PilF